MLAIKSALKHAEDMKRELLRRGMLDMRRSPLKEKGFIFFPVLRKDAGLARRYSFAEKEFSERRREKMTLRESLSQTLPEKELSALKTAFDSIGGIAILEIDEGLRPRAKTIAQELLRINKSVKTVLMKSSAHSGEFRTQKYFFLAGEDTRVADYKENNVVLRFDVEKVYFSVRLSTERARICSLVKKGEDVLVLFSGCAPYPCVIAKNTKAGEVWGVEKNPEGHRWGLENVRINHLRNVKLFCSDAHDFKTRKRFDRILMPLPKNAEDFLSDALRLAKRKAVIHFYDFLHEEQFGIAREKVKRACAKAKVKCRILRTVKCGQHSPRVYRVCVDFTICKGK